uniref:Uncharacterized protein n=1 Tax=Aegilops tauschii subsp. strangulata TaxID=200361 RepID=A0A453MDG9_AEGTS
SFLSCGLRAASTNLKPYLQLLGTSADPNLPSLRPAPPPAAMRIRRSASRLLGGAAAAFAPAPAPSDPPRFELFPPPPSPPATDQAHESSAGLVAPEAASCGQPCCELSRSPWELMAELDLSDPEVEECFKKTYFRTTRRASWLFPSSISMPNGSIKEKTTADMVDGAINMPAKTMEGKKNESKSKTNKGIKVKKGVRTCKKRDGKKPQKKRPVVDMGEAFYYYDGFGPSRSSKSHCRSSGFNSVLEEPPLPIEQQKDEVEKPRLNGSNANIVSCDEESSNDDALGCNGKQLHNIMMMKSPFKKRWRKPVKARSLKS